MSEITNNTQRATESLQIAACCESGLFGCITPDVHRKFFRK